jgi:hypothetical protein
MEACSFTNLCGGNENLGGGVAGAKQLGLGLVIYIIIPLSTRSFFTNYTENIILNSVTFVFPL